MSRAQPESDDGRLGLSLASFAESAVARTIFTLRRPPPASGLVALPDGSVVGTAPSDTGPVPGKALTWRLEPDGALRPLSGFGGRDICVAPDGTLFITLGSSVVRLSPDGGAVPVATGLMTPLGISASGDGRVLVADLSRNQIVSVSQGGTVVPVAGTGEQGFSGDGGPATAARPSSPTDVAPRATGAS